MTTGYTLTSLPNCADNQDHFIRPLDKELRKSLAELKKQKNCMQSVIGLIPDSLLVMKADGDIIGTNKATENIFGWHTKELLKMNISHLLSPDQKEKHARMIHGFIENSDPDNMRGMYQARPVTGVTKTGDNIKVSVSLARYDTPEENLGIAIIRDMSILERLNEALEEHLAATRMAKESKDRFV
ncbi:MAG: PAS domain S-box protein [Emcibacter sp.]|nr:PAS domain S-box protein [Emcibacter sp.]